MTTLSKRHRTGRIMASLFLASTIFAIIALITLLFSVIDQTAGYAFLEYSVSEEDILPYDDEGNMRSRESLGDEELIAVIGENISQRRLRALEAETPLSELSRKKIEKLYMEEVLDPRAVRTWSLSESVMNRQGVLDWVEENAEDGHLIFRFWLSSDFLSASQSSNALFAGVRSAIFGSLMTIVLTIVIAFPLSIGCAIYLEEYARDTRVNRFIKTNIYNLAGVPSIIYGMLGLGIFVRFLSPLTSGAVFGKAEGAGDGRTILSASLTLALLILPTLIINAQEAIRAVPRSLRESGFALGATKIQVILHHVLPASMDRILTGTVLAVSRGIGETAPLVLVGASTFLTQDPTGVFSRFTTLPIQIYQWTARPQAEFRNIAAAAILVLMILLLSLNTAAILMRNKYRSQRRV